MDIFIQTQFKNIQRTLFTKFEVEIKTFCLSPITTRRVQVRRQGECAGCARTPQELKWSALMRMKISFLKNDTKRKASRHFQHFEDLKFHTFYGEACLRTLKPLSSELAQPIIPILIIRSRFFTYTLPPTPHPNEKSWLRAWSVCQFKS